MTCPATGQYFSEQGSVTKLKQPTTSVFLGNVRAGEQSRPVEIAGKTILFNASPFSADKEPWHLSIIRFATSRNNTTTELEDLVISFVHCVSKRGLDLSALLVTGAMPRVRSAPRRRSATVPSRGDLPIRAILHAKECRGSKSLKTLKKVDASVPWLKVTNTRKANLLFEGRGFCPSRC